MERVGARKPIQLDIRVVATTNRDLAGEVAAGRFREDLFYRLSVFPLAWRPLRERPADIIPLAERLLNNHVKKMKHAQARLSPEAQACLVSYPWPGNVRELDNAIQRAFDFAAGRFDPAARLLPGHGQWRCAAAEPGPGSRGRRGGIGRRPGR